VEKFIGDAVMALFGAPAGHEDDPERAVLAALAIRDWVRAEEGVSFWALAEMVKAQAGILETDTFAEAGAKLAQLTSDVVPGASEADWVRRHLGALAGVHGGDAPAGGGRRDEAFAAWRYFVEALAEQRPLVLVFEDLHWADDGLLDFIDYLVDWAGEVPLLVVGSARPELLERRPGWGGGKPNALTLSLAPLSDTDTARLIGSVLRRIWRPGRGRRCTLPGIAPSR
jgi:predicted ATPase